MPRGGVRLIDSATFTLFGGDVEGGGSGFIDRAGILAEDNSEVVILIERARLTFLKKLFHLCPRGHDAPDCILL